MYRRACYTPIHYFGWKYNLITTIKGIKNVTYTDKDVESGKKYCYKVVAVNSKDNFLNSGYSAKKSIIVEKGTLFYTG